MVVVVDVDVVVVVDDVDVLSHRPLEVVFWHFLVFTTHSS
jgi:hypothetical protein